MKQIRYTGRNLVAMSDFCRMNGLRFDITIQGQIVRPGESVIADGTRIVVTRDVEPKTCCKCGIVNPPCGTVTLGKTYCTVCLEEIVR